MFQPMPGNQCQEPPFSLHVLIIFPENNSHGPGMCDHRMRGFACLLGRERSMRENFSVVSNIWTNE
jgi:hypothetical protein